VANKDWVVRAVGHGIGVPGQRSRACGLADVQRSSLLGAECQRAHGAPDVAVRSSCAATGTAVEVCLLRFPRLNGAASASSSPLTPVSATLARCPCPVAPPLTPQEWSDLPAPYKYLGVKVNPKDVESAGGIWKYFSDWRTVRSARAWEAVSSAHAPAASRVLTSRTCVPVRAPARSPC
jgi:hypothetical protein